MYSNSLSYLVGSAQEKLANDIKRIDKSNNQKLSFQTRSSFNGSKCANNEKFSFKSISKDSLEDLLNLKYLKWSIRCSLILIFGTLFSFSIYKVVLYQTTCCNSTNNTNLTLTRSRIFNTRYPWLNQHTPIIYEIETVTFFDSNNDGIGDLSGIMLKLDYIQKSLFVNCILVKSIQNGFSFKYYNLQLSKIDSIDEKIGNLDDLKLLMSEARKRSIKVRIS